MFILDTVDGPLYYCFAEGQNINDGTSSFMEVLQETFALYYICNMAYPSELSATLEFIQKYFFKIHPDCGSKNKRQSSTKFKVLNLMNKLTTI